MVSLSPCGVLRGPYSKYMTRIDLHTHSAYSDGTDTPAELMEKARQAHLDVVGLTDHDTYAGWDEAAACVERTGVSLVRGVELSCACEGITVHLLGYLPDPTNEALLAVQRRATESRLTRAQKIVERLAEDYPITWEQVRALAPEDGPVGRPHIADALVEIGAFPDRSAVFTQTLHPSSKYYVMHWAPDPVDAVELVRAAGGVPVLAHPRARARQRLLPEEVIDMMKDAGLFGIERDHRDHAEEDRADVERIARRLKLEVFGSSDYHGLGKPNQLGENLTDQSVLNKLEEEAFLEVLHP